MVEYTLFSVREYLLSIARLCVYLLVYPMLISLMSELILQLQLKSENEKSSIISTSTQSHHIQPALSV